MNLLKLLKRDKKPALRGIEHAVVKETPEQKKQRQIDEYLEVLKDSAKKKWGCDDAWATKWAWQMVEKKMAKQRLRGVPVACTVCGKSGINRETGQFVTAGKGKYRHQNCRG